MTDIDVNLGSGRGRDHRSRDHGGSDKQFAHEDFLQFARKNPTLRGG
jgi:hypothetical protein